MAPKPMLYRTRLSGPADASILKCAENPGAHQEGRSDAKQAFLALSAVSRMCGRAQTGARLERRVAPVGRLGSNLRVPRVLSVTGSSSYGSPPCAGRIIARARIFQLPE